MFSNSKKSHKMNKTELALAAIFRHCDEVAEGKRPPRSEQEGKEDARAWLGVKVNAASVSLAGMRL